MTPAKPNGQDAHDPGDRREVPAGFEEIQAGARPWGSGKLDMPHDRARQGEPRQPPYDVEPDDPVDFEPEPTDETDRPASGAADGTTIGRLTARTLSQFRPASYPKLVRGILPEDALVLVYGGWGAGKSFFGVDLACKIAFGEAWRGRAVTQGAVLYVAGEGPRSIENRIRAWCLRYGRLAKDAPDPPLAVIGNAPDLLHEGGDVGDVIAHGELLAKSVGKPLQLAIFDTLHACAPGSKEDAADTGAILARARRIGHELGCAVMVIHHSGKDTARGARGSSALEAAADVIIEIVEDAGIRTPIVRKMRDGEMPELVPFVVDQVTLQHDGEIPITAGVHCLTEPVVDENDLRRKQARSMREKGESFGAIAKTLGVAKSTVDRWCKQ